ncbi:NAD(P)-dependent alcohol dehydrogenase [Crateriforma conspicua]|uniref:Phthiocerol synthesis polyketide synthase type I PpsC n=1 Tax=Crateriforma conspicua TaxID=2527996 RepID=A0A5C6FJQ1_9PLAN|nr:NAD(P)-dependent alcohol dehydrogenase [Crateriforma conspicua]TWU62187.1 Phthiocerol synthesis polyketide synthase type I PpsC [Crateriforma conspicua]
MKAVHSNQYGSPEQLRVVDLAPPIAGAKEVLVRVHAAALHVGDCFTVRGKPFVVRVDTGWRRPKSGIVGYDFSGVVESVGDGGDGFEVGDEVFGYRSGTCAEYVAAPVSQTAKKPSKLSHFEAAALPTSGLAALHALRDVAKTRRGDAVLINGASGGIGTFAVQIAKIMKAKVTGVCSAKNKSLVHSLGADRVIDYASEDFTTGEEKYDCILDNVENRPLADVCRVLKPDGTLICNSGTGATGLAFWIRLLKPLLLSPLTSQKLRRFVSTPSAADLEELCRYVQDGQLSPVIAEVHTPDQVADALLKLEAGHTVGKRVVRMTDFANE